MANAEVIIHEPVEWLNGLTHMLVVNSRKALAPYATLMTARRHVSCWGGMFANIATVESFIITTRRHVSCCRWHGSQHGQT